MSGRRSIPEEVGTEFDVQGLELDWAGVCWDADFRYRQGGWNALRFCGTRWQQVNTSEGRLYLKNAYRVILTLARQGMIIFVPKGAANDPTRPPAYYDQTYDFLKKCGLPRWPSPAMQREVQSLAAAHRGFHAEIERCAVATVVSGYHRNTF